MNSTTIAAKTLFCLLATAPYLASQAMAAELDLNLNDDAARLTYAWDISPRDLRLDAGWLHHQDRGDVINFGLHLTGEASGGSNPLEGGLGGKLFYVDPDSVGLDATAVALGGFLKYTLPDYDRINAYAHVYFAPDVLVFGDGERYQEFEARIGYNVLREADIYLGMRYSNIRFEPGGSVTMDNGLHAGIQLRF
ncbi:MAG: YfaZ family outer membrane protein [Pseudomonadota bacterium]